MTSSYHSSRTRLAKIKRARQTLLASERLWGNRPCSTLSAGGQNQTILLEGWGGTRPYDSAVPLLQTDPLVTPAKNKMNSYTCIWCSTVCNSNGLETIQRSSKRRWKNKCWHIHTMRIYYTERRERQKQRERQRERTADRNLQDILLILKSKAQKSLYAIFCGGKNINIYIYLYFFQCAAGREMWERLWLDRTKMSPFVCVCEFGGGEAI